MGIARTILAAILLVAAVPAGAETIARGPVTKGPSELEVPRFTSLGARQVYMRSGPGAQYPISWVYKRRGLPVIVKAEFDVWRQIQDPDGTVGWVHGNLLSGRRMAYVTGQLRALRQKPDVNAPLVLRAEPGVLARFKKCDGKWCEMTILGYEGFMLQEDVWGTFTGEKID